MAVQDTQDRITQNVEVDSKGCWIWQLKSKDRSGYGRIKLNYKTLMAHRVSYEAFVGEIPTGLQIDHLCRVTSCVNPEHLEPVTAKENLHRSSLKALWAKKKLITHCPKGHEYSEQNTFVKKNRWGNDCRNCRACHRERNLVRYHKQKIEMAVA